MKVKTNSQNKLKTKVN